MTQSLPGHIRKAFKSIDRYLPVIDIVVELVDARMPSASRLSGYVDKLGKTAIVGLAKSDLAESAETRKWVKSYEKEGILALPLDCRKKKAASDLLRMIASVPLTRQTLRKRRIRRAMIVGIPNVGKSTLINSMAGRAAARTANKPGLTRNVQWIKLENGIELLDLPGILDYASLRRGDLLRLINTMPTGETDSYAQAKQMLKLMELVGNAHLIEGYGDSAGHDEFFADYALKRNFLAKGGEPDVFRAVNDIMKRFTNGGFGRMTIEKAGMEFDKICEEVFCSQEETLSNELF
ncbi:MAG: hypothetical protein GX221_11595 [Candidatus Riflebacteria bacterium]|nr:hypothetical protein [Candidatus Riflebacteria bacterium]